MRHNRLFLGNDLFPPAQWAARGRRGEEGKKKRAPSWNRQTCRHRHGDSAQPSVPSCPTMHQPINHKEEKGEGGGFQSAIEKDKKAAPEWSKYYRSYATSPSIKKSFYNEKTGKKRAKNCTRYKKKKKNSKTFGHVTQSAGAQIEKCRSANVQNVQGATLFCCPYTENINQQQQHYH